MKKNMGNADRIIRLSIAGILVLLWFQNILTNTWGIVALVLAAVFTLTSLASWCPLYTVMGVSTCKKTA
ncbi:MAG: DUF2892 domain-containing protein [Lacibacter sp.]|nr:DUF2892 domain-containing protein [Lacibacter sp.]